MQTGFFKGIGAGMLMGAAVGMAIMPSRRFRKRKIGKAVKSLGQVVEDVMDAVKL